MTKTNTGLVEYALTQLGKPYWWGTFGRHSNTEYKIGDTHEQKSYA